MLSTHLNRRPLSSRARTAAIGALMALTLAVASLGGQSVFYTIAGTVLDPTDRVLPGAKLVLTSALRGARYEVRSDATGRFEFVGLPEGLYTLEASLPGFATLKWQDINVQGDIQRDLRLGVGSLQETISVSEGSALAVPDSVVVQRREEARRGADERLQRALAQCTAAGDVAPVGGHILAPLKLVSVPPVYPEYLKASKVAGTVTMDAVIGTDGVVRDIKNLAGPHPALESAAADAVRQWQFSTTLLNCTPIEVDMRVTVNFAVQR
jgi:TonB family protein